MVCLYEQRAVFLISSIIKNPVQQLLLTIKLLKSTVGSMFWKVPREIRDEAALKVIF